MHTRRCTDARTHARTHAHTHIHTQVHGLQYGFWITPQAQPGTHALDNNPELYLAPAGNDTPPTRCCGLSYLLNLALPGAQDLFFSQVLAPSLTLTLALTRT